MNSKKQTAGNNAFLARVKKLMNKAIFGQTSLLLNTQGQAEAEAYLGQYFRADARESVLNKLAGR